MLTNFVIVQLEFVSQSFREIFDEIRELNGVVADGRQLVLIKIIVVQKFFHIFLELKDNSFSKKCDFLAFFN